MNTLAEEKCEACKADAPKISEHELAELIKHLPNWQPIVVENVMQLQRVFEFKNFQQAMLFSNRVGDWAEAQGHHPAMLLEWGRVTVTWWSHKIKGLHRNDFISAAASDKLYEAL